MDDPLYDCGLAFEANRLNAKSRNFNHPLVILLGASLFILAAILSTQTNDDFYLVILSELGHYFNAKTHFIILRCIAGLIVVAYILISYVQHKRGVKQPFIDLMKALNGDPDLKPKDVGIDKHQLNRFKTISRLMYNYMRYLCDSVSPFTLFAFQMIIYYTHLSGPMLIVCLINSTLNSKFFKDFAGIIANQLFVYHCLCVSFKIQLRKVNRELMQSVPNNVNRIMSSLNQLIDIHSQIAQTNQSFCSQFLAIFWPSFGLLTTFAIKVLMHRVQDWTLILVLTNSVIGSVAAFLFVILSAASLNKEAHRSRKILLSLKVNYNKYCDFESINKERKQLILRQVIILLL